MRSVAHLSRRDGQVVDVLVTVVPMGAVLHPAARSPAAVEAAVRRVVRDQVCRGGTRVVQTASCIMCLHDIRSLPPR
jgi:hypothetical protein